MNELFYAIWPFECFTVYCQFRWGDNEELRLYIIRSCFSDLYYVTFFILPICDPPQTGCIVILLLWYPRSVLLVPVSRYNNNIVIVGWLIFFFMCISLLQYYSGLLRQYPRPVDDPGRYNYT